MRNSFFSRFGPKEPIFFAYLNQVSCSLVSASKLLLSTLDSDDISERKEYFRKIKEQERKGDEILNKILEALSTSFITPFDREDIHLLSESLDDVIDKINSCAKRIAIYNPDKNNSYAQSLGQIISESAVCIEQAIEELSLLHNNGTKIKDHCITLHDLENQADDVYEESIIHLFEEEKDGIELIKTKEILGELENTTDAAEHVGKILKTIIVKYA